MKAFYIVRRSDTDPRDPRLHYTRPGEATSNAFDTFPEAREAAMRWAEQYRRNYVVYEVIELGRAGPSAPPVVWTFAP